MQHKLHKLLFDKQKCKINIYRKNCSGKCRNCPETNCFHRKHYAHSYLFVSFRITCSSVFATSTHASWLRAVSLCHGVNGIGRVLRPYCLLRACIMYATSASRRMYEASPERGMSLMFIDRTLRSCSEISSIRALVTATDIAIG